MVHPAFLRTRHGPGTGDASPAPYGSRHAIATVIAFIAAQPSGPDRLLTTHAPLPDGVCCGCLTHATRWPCTIAAFARSAIEHNAVANASPTD